MATKFHILLTAILATSFFQFAEAAPLNGLCASDSDCDLPYVCVKQGQSQLGSCQPKSCFSDSDCRQGTYCYKENPLQSTGTCKITPACTEAWVCTDWSQCSSGQQTRTCRDLNNCGTTNNRPALVRSCTTNVCGNGICESGESYDICPQDCPDLQEDGKPSGSAALGNNNPSDHTWFYNESSTDIWNELLQIKVSAGQNEDISLLQITLQASGTGNDAEDINKIEIYADLNNNGQVDAEPRIGVAQPAYNSDNGERTVALNYNIQKGDTKPLVIAYVMHTNAPAGRTYSFAVKEIIAMGRTSGTIFKIGGLPVNSGTKTVVSPPQQAQQQACAGIPVLSFKPNPATTGQPVDAAIIGMSNCLGFLATVIDENKVIACQTNLFNGADGTCRFVAPKKAGSYTYFIIVDKNQNGNIDIGEIGASNLNVILPDTAGDAGQQGVAPPEQLINSPTIFVSASASEPAQERQEQLPPPIKIPATGRQQVNTLLAAVAIIASGAAAYYYMKARQGKRKKQNK